MTERDIPVTTMSAAEYRAVFDTRHAPFHPDETMVDIGSGDSDLSGNVPNGLMVQVDSSYTTINQGRRPDCQLFYDPSKSNISMPLPSEQTKLIFVGVALTDNAEIDGRLLHFLQRRNPNRVTSASILQHPSHSVKIKAISTMLRIAPIVQLYPIRGSMYDSVVKALADTHLEVSRKFVVWPGRRQARHAATNMNWALTLSNRAGRKLVNSDEIGKIVAQLV